MTSIKETHTMKSNISKVRLHFKRNNNAWSTVRDVARGTGLNSIQARGSLTRYGKGLFESRTFGGIVQYRLIGMELVSD